VQTRLQGAAVWEILVFVINALLFTLLGLQLSGILDSLSGYTAGDLLFYAAAVTGAVIALRFLWLYVFAYVPIVRPTMARPPHSHRWVLGWSGMRGAVSLAAALAIPLNTDAGAPFPNRELIIFLTFAVILGTLVLQGLTLPALIRALRIEPDHLDEKEDAKARIHAAEAALGRLEELLEEDWVRDDTAERLRGLYNFRRDRFTSRFDMDSDGAIEEQSRRYQRLRRELLNAERDAIVELRRVGTINDEALRRLLRDLDLEDARLDV
jgi:monovalent cation/hydrogen antiporter